MSYLRVQRLVPTLQSRLGKGISHDTALALVCLVPKQSFSQSFWGKVERSHQTLKWALVKLCKETEERWIKLFLIALLPIWSASGDKVVMCIWTQVRLSDFTFTFHFHALEKEMATHYSVLAWRIPGMGEPGGLLSLGSHRVGHDWSDLAAAAAW